MDAADLAAHVPLQEQARWAVLKCIVESTKPVDELCSTAAISRRTLRSAILTERPLTLRLLASVIHAAGREYTVSVRPKRKSTSTLPPDIEGGC